MKTHPFTDEDVRILCGLLDVRTLNEAEAHPGFDRAVRALIAHYRFQGEAEMQDAAALEAEVRRRAGGPTEGD